MNNREENEEEKEIDKDIHTETTHTQQREKGVSKNKRPREQRNEICSISNPLPLIHPHQPFQIKFPDHFIIQIDQPALQAPFPRPTALPGAIPQQYCVQFQDKKMYSS